MSISGSLDELSGIAADRIARYPGGTQYGTAHVLATPCLRVSHARRAQISSYNSTVPVRLYSNTLVKAGNCEAILRAVLVVFRRR